MTCLQHPHVLCRAAWTGVRSHSRSQHLYSACKVAVQILHSAVRPGLQSNDQRTNMGPEVSQVENH